MRRRFFTLILALILLLTLPLVAYAHDAPQVDRDDCSIDVIIRDKKKQTGITDGKVICVRVGYVDHDGDQNYYFYDVQTGEIIENVEVSSTAGKIYDDIKDHLKDFETYEVDQVDKDGTFHFHDLKTGLYLVVQTDAAKGYSKMNPFLVSVPYLEDGKYVYEVTAEIKTELEQEIETTQPPATTTPGGKLPQTGQLNWPVPALAVGGLTLFAFGWALRFGRKKEEYEK